MEEEQSSFSARRTFGLFINKQDASDREYRELGAYRGGPESIMRKRQTAARAALASFGFWIIVYLLTLWTNSLALSVISTSDMIRFLLAAALLAIMNYAYFRTNLCLRVRVSFRNVTLIVVMIHALLVLALSIEDEFSPLTGFSLIIGICIILAFLGLTHGFMTTLLFGLTVTAFFSLIYTWLPPGPLTLPQPMFGLMAFSCLMITAVMATINGINRRVKYKLVELLKAQRKQAEIIQKQNENLDLKAAELTQANSTLRQMSMVDGLTQIANRRCFEDTLKREWVRLVRQQAQLQTAPKTVEAHSRPPSIALLLLDIDHFKAYNDYFGHLAGDDCLRGVSQAIQRSTLRLNDLTARFGGEEFAVLLPDTDLGGAEQVALRILNNIEQLAIRHPTAPSGKITASIGLAHIIDFTDLTSQDLVHMADKALYAAKAQGRNRLVKIVVEKSKLSHTHGLDKISRPESTPSSRL